MKEKKISRNVYNISFMTVSIIVIYYYKNDPFLMSRINSNYTQVDIANEMSAETNANKGYYMIDKGAFLQRWRTAVCFWSIAICSKNCFFKFFFLNFFEIHFA